MLDGNNGTPSVVDGITNPGKKAAPFAKNRKVFCCTSQTLHFSAGISTTI